VTESVNVEFVDEDTGKGDSVWRWSNEYHAYGVQIFLLWLKWKLDSRYWRVIISDEWYLLIVINVDRGKCRQRLGMSE
jgi:hypothetical protein